jgi:hypothetical protein
MVGGKDLKITAIEVTFNDITAMLNLMKIFQLVQTLLMGDKD